MKFLLLFTLLIPLTIEAQQSKREPEPERLHCKVISIDPDVMLDCADEEGTQLSLKPLRAPAGLNLKDKHLNPEVSTVVLERTATKLCLVQVNIMGGWVKEPANQQHECVELRKTRNHKRKK